MGGCCSSSRKLHLRGTPVYYYCPPPLEQPESLTSHDGAASALAADILVRLDLETSIPDTYRPPPTPLPFDIVLRCPQVSDSEFVKETISGCSFETLATCNGLQDLDCKTQSATCLLSPNKLQLSANEYNIPAAEEEDECPICLEEYGAENPKSITKCEHNFHLSCILEWTERSDACPICNKEMIFDH